jgi:chorismate dehydratase
MPGLRISAISFLNTAPLMWDFEHGDVARYFEIEYTVPSVCAAALAANHADIGIIPAFAYAEIPELVILPDIAIASKDRVRSILLVSKKPIEQVESVATDSSSRTSVALLQILFTKFFGGRRQLMPHPPQLEAMLRQHDAALLIGDAALRVQDGSAYHTYDLAHVWHRLTGKPFVFAFWAVRLDALGRQSREVDLAEVFQRSRDHGLEPENIAAISEEWSPRLGMAPYDIRRYLTENIHYYLDRENHAGLRLFLQYSREIGLLAEIPELRFLGPVAFGKACK